MSFIKANNITTGYIKEKNIIKNISFNIHKSDFTGIVGPNGSGKTTLLKALIGFLKLKNGTISIDNKNILDIPHAELSKQISFIPSFLSIPFPFLVYEFILMGRFATLGRFKAVGKKDIDYINDTMKLLEIEHLKDRNIQEISSGEFQHVLIAQGLVQDPKILILDEPISHLDIKHKVSIMKILKDLNNKGLTIISVFHDLNIASDYCKKMIILKNGKLYKEGSLSQVINKETIEHVYEIPVIINKSPTTDNNYVYY